MAKKRKQTRSSNPKTKRAAYASALRRLETRDGRLTAEMVLRAASDPKHALHDHFDWDDSEAAHQWRLHQARMLIAQVRVVITTSTKKVVAPGYVRDMEAHPRAGHIATARLQTAREAAEETLLYETTRLQATLERCREIAAALELESELEAILSATFDLRSRLRKGKHQRQEEEPRINA